MNNEQSSSINFFLLGDSHGKYIPSSYSTPSYSLTTRSIPGLKWVDYREENLSVYAALSWPEIQRSLSQASGILFLVGTNSVRILRAKHIIPQIRQVISYVHGNHSHLSHPGKISISITFPCFKTTRSFPSRNNLMYNIDLYNEELKLLSSELNFNIIDFKITSDHLAYDQMHIHYRFRDRIFNSIINHFDQIVESISTPTVPDPTPPSSSPLPSTSSTTTTDPVNPPKKTKSPAVLEKKRKKRLEQMKLKRQQHTTKRKIHHQWTAALIKEYLDSLEVKYSRIPPVFNKTLRIMFNNQHDQDSGEKQLAIDIFDEKHYQEFVNKNS